MSYSLIRLSTPKARKPHRCIWCGENILIGEKHTKEAGKFDGDFQSNRYHEECAKASQEWFSGQDHNDDGFEPWSFKRGSTQEKFHEHPRNYVAS